MGARSPVNERPRRGGLKCEFCSRSFPTALSLRSHQNSLHANALKEKAKRVHLMKAEKIQKGIKAKVVVKPQITLVKSKPKLLPAKKSVPKETPTKQTETVVKTAEVETKENQVEKKIEMDLKAPPKIRKVEFKCPACVKVFTVFFSAKKHIQKYHSNKAAALEPIRTEFCIICNTMVADAIDGHSCNSSHDLTGLSLTYMCTGCNQKFHTMRLFDIHVSGVHAEGVESMFFPTIEEFNKWKNAMEEQTKSSYLLMGKYQYKQIYRCSKTTIKEEDDTSPTYFCPSTLIFQEFTKGIQVHFYKEHFGHTCLKYILRDQYKTYSLTDMLQQALGYSEITDVKSEENDLYCQFKKLMESIVLDAAKINIDTLQILVGKALEMISFLKKYNVDDDFENPTLLLSRNRDHELAKALEALNNVSKATKRPINASVEVPPVKRLNKTESLDKSPILQKPMTAKPTMNKFSLADNRDDQKILKELGGANTNKVSSPKPLPRQKTIDSPSFNDTYKDFVEKNLVPPSSKIPPVTNTGPVSAKKRDVLKTKMGQFKPENSPKQAVGNGTGTSSRVSRSSVGKPSDTKYEVKEQANDCTSSRAGPRSCAGEPNDIKYAVKKQENDCTSSRVSGRSAGKSSDIKYEVKERENDCNILILKI